MSSSSLITRRRSLGFKTFVSSLIYFLYMPHVILQWRNNLRDFKIYDVASSTDEGAFKLGRFRSSASSSSPRTVVRSIGLVGAIMERPIWSAWVASLCSSQTGTGTRTRTGSKPLPIVKKQCEFKHLKQATVTRLLRHVFDVSSLVYDLQDPPVPAAETIVVSELKSTLRNSSHSEFKTWKCPVQGHSEDVKIVPRVRCLIKLRLPHTDLCRNGHCEIKGVCKTYHATLISFVHGPLLFMISFVHGPLRHKSISQTETVTKHERIICNRNIILSTVFKTTLTRRDVIYIYIYINLVPKPDLNFLTGNLSINEL